MVYNVAFSVKLTYILFSKITKWLKQESNHIDSLLELTTVRALAASFGPVPTKSGSKKMRSRFFWKEQKQLRCPYAPRRGSTVYPHL